MRSGQYDECGGTFCNKEGQFPLGQNVQGDIVPLGVMSRETQQLVAGYTTTFTIVECQSSITLLSMLL